MRGRAERPSRFDDQRSSTRAASLEGGAAVRLDAPPPPPRRPLGVSHQDLEAGIPEIQDLNVLPEFRRQGIASRLLEEVEALAGERSSVVGIGVGLHPGYNAAQRLYGKRGYIPDGRGITYCNRFLEEGAQIVLDDDLILHLTKHSHS